MKKGIVDPWRVSTPLRPTKEKKPAPTQRINLSDIDFDAALKMTQYYIIRSNKGSIKVDSKQITTEIDAIVHLIEGFFSLVTIHQKAHLFKEAGIGFEVPGRAWNVPTTPMAGIETPEASLYFANHNYEQGMAMLIKVLNQIDHVDRGLLRKYGISILIR